MPLSEADVQAALSKLVDPNTGKDFVATRSVKNVRVDGAAREVDQAPAQEPVQAAPQANENPPVHTPPQAPLPPDWAAELRACKTKIELANVATHVREAHLDAETTRQLTEVYKATWGAIEAGL